MNGYELCKREDEVKRDEYIEKKIFSREDGGKKRL